MKCNKNREKYMKRSVSTASAVLDSSIDDVWNKITDNENWQWRSDLQNLKILNEKEFIEYGKGGMEIHFTITKKEKYKLYAFNMDCNQFTGEWTGVFEKTQDGKTKITFTESIAYKKWFLRIIASLFVNLKAIQDEYMRDLKQALGET
jgi:hypothetical protein